MWPVRTSTSTSGVVGLTSLTLKSDEAAGKTTGARRVSVIHDGWPYMAKNLTRTAGSRRIAMRSWNAQLKAWAELDSRPVPLWPTTPVTTTDTMTITSVNTNSRYHDDNYHDDNYHYDNNHYNKYHYILNGCFIVAQWG